MHEDLTTVITGEEAIPLVGGVPLDLAGRHAQTSGRRELMDNQRSGDRQDAMGTSKAIGPRRRTALGYRRLRVTARQPWAKRAHEVQSKGPRPTGTRAASGFHPGSGLTRSDGAGTGSRARPESECDLPRA